MEQERIPVVAECNAEYGLAEALRPLIESLGSVSHKPRSGGHERIIVESIQMASKAGFRRLLVIVDYEATAESRHYSDMLCMGEESARRVIKIGRAEVILCRRVFHIRGREPLVVYSILSNPRIEDLLAEAGLSIGDPRVRRRIKRDPGYVRRSLESGGTHIVERIAKSLEGMLSEAA